MYRFFVSDQTKEGTPPKNYFLGSEYNSEDINKAILENDSSLTVDEVGSGTILSGICSGLGNVNPEYVGVAKDSELIVVKLQKINGEYNNGMLSAGLEYVYQKARELNMPVCVNLSVGSSGLVGFDNSTLFKKTFFERGIFISAGSGDDVNRELHTTGIIPIVGEEKVIEIEVNEDSDEIEIQVWIDRPYKVEVQIESPSGELSKASSLSNFNQFNGLFDLEQTSYVITYVYPTTYSGQQFTSIILENVKVGIWKIRLTGIYKSSGNYNIYIVNPKSNKIKFRDSDPFYTINYMGVSPYITTVGNYNSINKTIYTNSSRGPNIKGVMKPDLVAPGVNIIGPFRDDRYSKVTGSGASNSYVVGCAALFMQYTVVDNRYPEKAYPQIIKTYIQGGCKRDILMDYPNNSFGFGLLDFRGLFDEFR
ncbi:MAG: S8 family peptidase [Peptostreptococcaceae bacterium]